MNSIFKPSLALHLPLYELDGSSIASKDAYGHLGTVTGALWRPNGHYLDGIDDNINLGKPGVLNFQKSTDFSWLVWFKPVTVAPTHQSLISEFDIANYKYLGIATNKIRFDYGGGAETASCLSASIWYLVGLIHVADTTAYLVYLNGGFKETLTQTGTGACTGSIYIGSSKPGAPPSSYPFSGLIGEVLMYNRALTPQEIQNIYLATKWRYQ